MRGEVRERQVRIFQSLNRASQSSREGRGNGDVMVRKTSDARKRKNQREKGDISKKNMHRQTESTISPKVPSRSESTTTTSFAYPSGRCACTRAKHPSHPLARRTPASEPRTLPSPGTGSGSPGSRSRGHRATRQRPQRMCAPMRTSITQCQNLSMVRDDRNFATVVAIDSRQNFRCHVQLGSELLRH